jgi:hypothetical protein
MDALREFSVPSALFGQVVLFAFFVLVANALLREAARVVIRILLVLGLVLVVALLAGWMDESAVGKVFETVGDYLIRGIRAVVGWLREAWQTTAESGADR